MPSSAIPRHRGRPTRDVRRALCALAVTAAALGLTGCSSAEDRPDHGAAPTGAPNRGFSSEGTLEIEGEPLRAGSYTGSGIAIQVGEGGSVNGVEVEGADCDGASALVIADELRVQCPAVHDVRSRYILRGQPSDRDALEGTLTIVLESGNRRSRPWRAVREGA